MKEEHAIWQGAKYAEAAERWAVLGFSHYDRDWSKPDSSCAGLDAKKANFTTQLLTQTVEGRCDLRFFRDLAKAFGATDLEPRKRFWEQVVFFNYLPTCVDAHEMFRTATKAERERGNARFCQALATYKPDRVFVFSKKAWKLMPKTDEANRGEPSGSLHVSSYEYGTYTIDTHKQLACCLQHPTHADHSLLRQGVLAFLGVVG